MYMHTQNCLSVCHTPVLCQTAKHIVEIRILPGSPTILRCEQKIHFRHNFDEYGPIIVGVYKVSYGCQRHANTTLDTDPFYSHSVFL